MIAKWPATATFPFGYGRAETLAGLVNALMLLFIALSMGTHALERLFDPVTNMQTSSVLLVATLGLLVNLVGILAFDGATHMHHGSDENSLPLAHLSSSEKEELVSSRSRSKESLHRSHSSEISATVIDMVPTSAITTSSPIDMKFKSPFPSVKGSTTFSDHGDAALPHSHCCHSHSSHKNMIFHGNLIIFVIFDETNIF